MNRLKFKRTDVIIIVIIFVLYMIGYAWMIEPKKKSSMKDDVVVHQAMTPRPSTKPKKPKSLPPEWSVDPEDSVVKHEFDEASYFQDHYDDYLDDPEDEIRFPPEIFDANED
jgi:hypothetical protein